MKKIYLLTLCVLLCTFKIFAQEQLSITKMNESVTIDGLADEVFWSSVSTIDIDNNGDSEAFSWLTLEEPSDDSDFKATGKVAFDENGLYLFFEIKDDNVTIDPLNLDTVANTEAWSQLKSFDADKIELYFKMGDPSVAANGGNINGSADKGYYQLAVWAGDAPLKQYASSAPKSETFDVYYNYNSNESFQYGYSKTLDGWNAEIFVGWDFLTDEKGKAFVPKEGNEFVMDISVRDNDNELNDDGQYPGDPMTVMLWSSNGNIHNVDSETKTWENSNLGTVTISNPYQGTDAKELTITKTSDEIVIDGYNDEESWSNIEPNTVSNPGNGDASFDYTFHWLDLEQPTDENDFSPSFKTFFDEKGLYLFFEIKDDNVTIDPLNLDTVANTEAWSQLKSFDADKIELYFKMGDPSVAANGGNINGSADKGYYQLAVWAGDAPLKQYASSAPKSETFDVYYNYNSNESFQYGYSKTLDGWNAEIFVGWDFLTDEEGKAFVPKDGSEFTMDVQIRDNDNELGDNGQYPGNPMTIMLWSDDRNIHNVDKDTKTWESFNLGKVTISNPYQGTDAKELTITKTSDEIVIDGYNDEESWSNIEPNTVSNPGNGDASFDYTFHWLDLEQPTDENDFSASFKTLYDDAGMYFLFEVNDDNLTIDPLNLDTVANTEAWSQLKSFDADKIELYFKMGDPSVAANGGNINGSADKGYYQLVVWAGDAPLKQFASSAPKSPTFDVYYNYNSNESFKYGYSQTLDGWNAEIFVGWDFLTDEDRKAFVPEDGKEFIMDVQIRDNDNEIGDNGQYPGNPMTIMLWSDNRNIHNVDKDTKTWENFNLGTVTINSNLVSIEDVDFSGQSVRYFPNPAMDVLRIDNEIDQVKILSLLGQEIMRCTNLNGHINVSSLAKGIYVISFYKNDKIIATGKLNKL